MSISFKSYIPISDNLVTLSLLVNADPSLSGLEVGQFTIKQIDYDDFRSIVKISFGSIGDKEVIILDFGVHIGEFSNKLQKYLSSFEND